MLDADNIQKMIQRDMAYAERIMEGIVEGRRSRDRPQYEYIKQILHDILSQVQ